jgi:hypothetical protein
MIGLLFQHIALALEIGASPRVYRVFDTAL